jgi:hypothetical protein
MPQCHFDLAALRRILGIAKRAVTRADIQIHDCSFGPCPLHHIKWLTGINRAKLFLVTDADKAVEFQNTKNLSTK